MAITNKVSNLGALCIIKNILWSHRLESTVPIITGPRWSKTDLSHELFRCKHQFVVDHPAWPVLVQAAVWVHVHRLMVLHRLIGTALFRQPRRVVEKARCYRLCATVRIIKAPMTMSRSKLDCNISTDSILNPFLHNLLLIYKHVHMNINIFQRSITCIFSTPDTAESCFEMNTPHREFI